MKKYKLEKEIEVYSLEEMLADPEKKKNLLEKNQFSEQQIQMFMDERMNELEGQLEEIGFKDASIRYDISCCQGSGACFRFSDVDFLRLQDCLCEPFDFSLVKDLPENMVENAILDGFRDTLYWLEKHDHHTRMYTRDNSFANHYCHSKTIDLELEEIESIEDKDDLSDIVNNLLETQDWDGYMKNIQAAVYKTHQWICGNIYKEMSEEYESWSLEDNIIENLRSNGSNEFTADGKEFNQNLFDYPEFNITEVEVVQC